jgi:hypothetical protein
MIKMAISIAPIILMETSYIEFPKPAIKNDFTVSLWAMLESIPTEGTIRTAMSIGSSGGDQLINVANNYYGGIGMGSD